MTDLKALAYEFLHEAQHSLKGDGYLNPTAVVITPDENLIFDIVRKSTRLNSSHPSISRMPSSA